MNTNLDKIKLLLTLAAPQVSDEKKVKEIFKTRIEDLDISDFHKQNMKAIVESAKNRDQMLENLGCYILANY